MAKSHESRSAERRAKRHLSPSAVKVKKRRSRTASSSSTANSSSSSSSGSSSSRSSSSSSSSRSSSSRSSSRSNGQSKVTKVHVGKLTRNVNREHLVEIFENYGKVKQVEMPPDRLHQHLSRGYAYVEFATPREAKKACEFMNGAMIDGQEIHVSFVNPQQHMIMPGRGRANNAPPPWRRDYNRRPPPMRRSPPRRSRSNHSDRKRRYSRSSSD